MKKIITTTIAAGMISAAATASVDVTMDFASAYVFRGVTFNDGFVFQPGIEAGGLGLPEAYGSVAIGAWANYDIDDYGGTLNSSDFSEVDWYAGYSLPVFVDGLDLFLGYCEYTYPGTAAAVLPADKEVNLGAGYEIAGVSIGLTYYQLVGGSVKGDSFTEVALGYSIDLAEGLALGLSADMRYKKDDNGGESGFNDYTLGADLGYALSDIWGVGASLVYIGQGDDAVLTDAVYDVDVVGMLSVSASM